jgi:hypothetical protein
MEEALKEKCLIGWSMHQNSSSGFHYQGGGGIVSHVAASGKSNSTSISNGGVRF